LELRENPDEIRAPAMNEGSWVGTPLRRGLLALRGSAHETERRIVGWNRLGTVYSLVHDNRLTRRKKDRGLELRPSIPLRGRQPRLSQGNGGIVGWNRAARIERPRAGGGTHEAKEGSWIGTSRARIASSSLRTYEAMEERSCWELSEGSWVGTAGRRCGADRGHASRDE
jgi:hypothetical protein